MYRQATPSTSSECHNTAMSSTVALSTQLVHNFDYARYKQQLKCLNFFLRSRWPSTLFVCHFWHYNQNMIITRNFEIKTNGNHEIHDITGQVSRIVKSSGLPDGLVTIFVPGNTMGVTTIECEGGQRGRLPESFAKLDFLGHTPEDIQVKAALMGTSMTLPFARGALPLSIWQQIILIDFGQGERWHLITVQVMGDTIEKTDTK